VRCGGVVREDGSISDPGTPSPSGKLRENALAKGWRFQALILCVNRFFVFGWHREAALDTSMLIDKFENAENSVKADS